MYTEATTIAAQPKTRFWVTMVNRKTSEEQSLEVRPEKESFAAIATAVRKKYSFEWEILEWFDPDCPF